MDTRLAAKYRHFTMLTHHDTRIVRPRTITYGSYDEGTTALILAMIGLGLMAATTVSMLFAFSIL